MVSRFVLSILPVLMLPALIGCSSETSAPPPPPLSDAALAAIKGNPDVGRTRLARAVDALFIDDDTRAVLVLQNGEIVAERYAPGYDAKTRFISWSMAKTITGVMIGQLVSDGRLRLDETAPVPAWQRSGDPRGEITLRHLLQMRSGLRHSEGAAPVYTSDEVRMLFLDGRDSMAAYAEAQPLEAEPGRKFEYSTASTIILADLAARALTESSDPALRRKAVLDYLQTRLLEPIGLTSMVPEFDAAGTLIGGSMIHATARDWGKFGEFMRHGGSVGGAQLVPRSWMDFMRHSSPRNPAYGAQIWLNHAPDRDSAAMFPRGVPASAFASRGHLGQYVAVSPEQGLTVVRLGKTPREDRPRLETRIGDLMALFPKI